MCMYYRVLQAPERALELFLRFLKLGELKEQTGVFILLLARLLLHLRHSPRHGLRFQHLTQTSATRRLSQAQARRAPTRAFFRSLTLTLTDGALAYCNPHSHPTVDPDQAAWAGQQQQAEAVFTIVSGGASILHKVGVRARVRVSSP